MGRSGLQGNYTNKSEQSTPLNGDGVRRTRLVDVKGEELGALLAKRTKCSRGRKASDRISFATPSR